MKKAFYLIIALLIFCASCKNEESSESVWLQQSWKLTSQEILTSNQYPTQVALSECYKDDIYVFNTEGTYTVKGGTVQCTGSDAKPLLEIDNAAPGVLISDRTWNIPFTDLGSVGSQVLLSITSKTLKTKAEFSGREPVIFTYTAVK